MKTFNRVLFIALLVVCCAHAQTALTSTTLSSAVTQGATSIVVASATGISAPSATAGGTMLYVMDLGQAAGEVLRVNSVSGTTIGVRRGNNGTQQVAHASGALVIIGNANQFFSYDPSGSCTASATTVTPWINVSNGRQWLCSTVTGTWVPGFGNNSAPAGATAAVASTAGLITPSGPLFHITGTAAITGFTVPIGYNGGPICVIPDGAFTTTTANNIALASTGVVSKTLCWSYDGKAAKPFMPSY